VSPELIAIEAGIGLSTIRTYLDGKSVPRRYARESLIKLVAGMIVSLVEAESTKVPPSSA